MQDVEVVTWVLEVLEAPAGLVDHRDKMSVGAMTRAPPFHARTALADRMTTTRTKDRASNRETMASPTLVGMDQAALIREASEEVAEEAWATQAALGVDAVVKAWAAVKATLTSGMLQLLEEEEGDSKEVADSTKARTLKLRFSQASQDPVNL